jgi:hypothetical protein
MSITAADLEAAKNSLPPERYAAYLGSLNLDTIILKSASVKLLSNELGERNSFVLKEDYCTVEQLDKTTVVEVTYNLSAKSDKRKLVTVQVKYWVRFLTSEPLPPEFFTIYNAASLPLQTFPYFRELVNSIFSRCGLPPLILPLRKYLVKDGK